MKVCVRIFILSLFLQFCQLKSIAQNTAGDIVFGTPQIHDVYLNFSQAGWWDSLKANYITDIYMKCNITFNGTSYVDVGVKFKGNSSYNNPGDKKSLKIGMDEFNTILHHDGLKKFNLNNGFKDPSFLREKLALDFANQMGVISPRCTYARVYLNNVYWGLYALVEEINKTFLDDHFPDKKGNLFKGDPSGDLKWLGSTASLYYNKYELKTNTTTNNWSDLVRLIDKIANTSAISFYDSLEAVMNTASTIKGWAHTNIFSNLDSYLGSGHNYYIYDDSTTLKFGYIIWDVNESFGNFTMGMTVAQIEALSMFFISNPQANRPLYQKMLANTTYKDMLVTEICNMANYFSNANLDAKIDSLKNMIMVDVQNDTNKFYTYTQFLNNITSTINVPGNPGGSNIPGIKSFIQNKHTALVNELAGQGCFVGMNDIYNGNSFSIYPNPSNGNSVLISSSTGIKNIELFNSIGEKLFENKVENKSEYSLIIDHLNNGIYFVRINNSAGRKIIVTGN